jgi:hypothetical protein
LVIAKKGEFRSRYKITFSVYIHFVTASYAIQRIMMAMLFRDSGLDGRKQEKSIGVIFFWPFLRKLFIFASFLYSGFSLFFYSFVVNK